MKKPIPKLLVLTALFLASCGGAPASTSAIPSSESSSQGTSSGTSSESSPSASSSETPASSSETPASSSEPAASSSSEPPAPTPSSSSEESSSSESSSVEPIVYVTLTLDANGGSVPSETIDVEKGKPAVLPTPTKKGKEFLGWYTGFGEKDKKIDDSTVFDEDMKLVAEWNEYDVSFLDGKGEVFNHQAIKAGKMATRPSGTPTQDPAETTNISFNGWKFDFALPLHEDYQVLGSWSDKVAKEVTYTLLESSYFEGSLDLVFHFQDDLFLEDASHYSPALAKASYGLSSATFDKAHMSDFYEGLGFDNVIFSANFDTPTTTSIGYAIAHKEIDGADLIAVAIRGHKYKQEWANNFVVGDSGDHAGFLDAANQLIAAVGNYVEENYKKKTLKYWVSGYSRAGAVANLAVNNMLKDPSGLYDQDNVYAYTFEAPRGVAIGNVVECPNLFNMVNDADLIARLLPEEYGLTRAGVDKPILPEDIDAALQAVKKDFSIGTFTPTSTYATESELPTVLIDALLTYGTEQYAKWVTDCEAWEIAYKEWQEGGEIGDAPVKPEKPTEVKASLFNREMYVDNYQAHIAYILEIGFGLKSSTLEALLDDIKAKAAENFMSILGIIGDGQSLYNYLKPFIDEDGYPYEEDKALKACEAASLLVLGPVLYKILPVFSDVVSESGITALGDVFSRLIAHHMPEVIYAFVQALK